MEIVAAFFGERQTDQAAGVARHEVDDFRRDLLRRANNIAFVLAILVVNDDDHAAVANVRYGLVNSRKSHVIVPLGGLCYLKASNLSTYFPITSTSRLTLSPGFRWERFVSSQVLGIIAISK